MAGIATFGPGTTSGVPISGSLGPKPITFQGAPNTIQNTTPTSNQYLLSTNPGGDNVTTNSDGTTTTQVDPYAQYGGYANYQILRNYYDNAKNTAYGSIGDAENNNAGQYHSSILDYLTGLQTGQNNIDNETVNNLLARKQGSDAILKTVGEGIRSAGIRLAGGNASSSSAAKQLAEAFGENGRDQMANVNNQFELGQNNIANDQNNFNITQATNRRHLDENKSTIVNGIVDDAVQKLGALNAQAASASLPDQINIEAEKQRIRDEAMGKLTAFDQELNNGQAGVHPLSQADALTKAFNLAEAGKASTTPFDINTVLPVNTVGAAAGTSPLAFYPVPAKQKQ
jgi:hypothetical protein